MFLFVCLFGLPALPADPCKRNWYGVNLNDAVEGAAKLGLTPDAMRAARRATP